jgi:hypothetical protein
MFTSWSVEEFDHERCTNDKRLYSVHTNSPSVNSASCEWSEVERLRETEILVRLGFLKVFLREWNKSPQGFYL